MSKSPSLRRIQADIRELRIDPSDRYVAAPLEDDMFEWHFTIRGADGTEFEGGVYHGRILLPPDYPFKPPNIVFLTPSGRFEVGTKVCLSFSAHHPELWQPAWGIRLILEALISFLPTPADGAIGALDWTKVERKRLAKKSAEFCCSKCGNCAQLLPKLKDTASSGATNRFQKEIEKLHALQASHHENQDDEMADENDDAKEEDENKKEAAAPEQEEPSKGEVAISPDGNANEVATVESGKHEEKKEVGATVATETESTKEAPAAATSQSQKSAKEDKEAAAPSPAATTTSTSEPAGTRAPTAAPAPAPAVVRAELRVAIPSDEPPLSPLSSDPVVHAIILLFAILVAMLYRKFIALVQELQSMSQEY